MMIGDKSKIKLINFGFYCFITFIIEIILFLFDSFPINSEKNDISLIICVMIMFAIFIGFFIFIINHILRNLYLRCSLHFNENSDFSFSNIYNFNKYPDRQFPQILINQEDDDPDLSILAYKAYSNYNNYISATINGVSYIMNERTLHTGKGGRVCEFICIAKHRKNSIPDFYIRQKYLLADSILSFFSSDYIRFPEDSEFSHKYVLTEKQHIQGNSKKEEIKNFFTAEIREIFKKNHVVDAAFCNCDTHEFKIKVQRHLKESEKEKLFIICDTLLGKNIDKEHVCGY